METNNKCITSFVSFCKFSRVMPSITLHYNTITRKLSEETIDKQNMWPASRSVVFCVHNNYWKHMDGTGCMHIAQREGVAAIAVILLLEQF